MAFRKSSLIRFDKILVGALGLLFGIVGLVLAYQAVKTSTEQRSKAAEEQKIYKQWEFTSGPEIWTGNEPVSVSDGLLSMTVGAKTGVVYTNNKVDASLPRGNKYLGIRMAAVPKTKIPGELRQFTLSIAYWTQGEDTGKQPKAQRLQN